MFCYDAAGAKVYLPFSVEQNYTGSVNKLIDRAHRAIRPDPVRA